MYSTGLGSGLCSQGGRTARPCGTRLWPPLGLACASLSLIAGNGLAQDPFAGVEPAPAPTAPVPVQVWWRENLLFRKEVQAVAAATTDHVREKGPTHIRLSAGFELQKRFATATRTFAAADLQGRLVFRDQPLDTPADPMGTDTAPWTYETHNAYVDVFNLGGAPGRLNLRVGRFYLPFGLNTQTDTHAALLQLSNARLFGTERDWQVTSFGYATEHWDYLAGWVLGSGMNQELDGQTGMGMGRLALGNAFLFERGLEGGVSVACGERLDPSVAGDKIIRTWRGGADLRQRLDSAVGPFTLATELAIGEDAALRVWSALAQAEWLHPGRQWGLAAQYFRFERERDPAAAVSAPHGQPSVERTCDERATLVLTRYFRNDVSKAALHWVAVAVEWPLQSAADQAHPLLTVQYYRYW